MEVSINLSTDPPRVIIDPPGEPEANMARDEQLALAVRKGSAPPTLRLYGWSQEAVSIGRRQSLDDLPQALLQKELPIVRRLTGGGAVVHRPDELTYAMAIPRTGSDPGAAFLKSVRGLTPNVHSAVKEALVTRGLVRDEDLSIHDTDPAEPALVCFSTPVCGDLLYHGRKVAGAALRVWREGVLIQGSIQGLPVERVLLQETLFWALVKGMGVPSRK